MMKVKEFIEILQKACDSKTAYMWGTYGSTITESLIDKKAKQYPTRYSDNRKSLLNNYVGKGYYAFDCVGLIKGILWGWPTVKYGSNSVPDTTASGLKKYSTGVTTDFSNIEAGELLWAPGHIGVYIGNGEVIEATLRGNLDGVVKTKLTDYSWVEHGKIKFVDYTVPVEPAKPTNTLPWKVGDIIFFCGGNVYASSKAPYGSASQAKAGPAKITLTAPDAMHVYHIVHTDETSNVYGWVDEPYVGIYTPPTPTPEPTPTPTPEPQPEPTPVNPEFAKNEIVQFIGGKHYSSSNATYGVTVKAGPAKITAISAGKAHPYHIVHTDKTSTVYGWVDAESINKITQNVPTPVNTELKVGDIVEFKGGKNYICSNGLIGYSRKAGPAKITKISKGKKYPYHVVRISGKGSNVYGWVKEDQIKKK